LFLPIDIAAPIKLHEIRENANPFRDACEWHPPEPSANGARCEMWSEQRS
jgi:hypothetical protein